jgi:hypothetical protein
MWRQLCQAIEKTSGLLATRGEWQDQIGCDATFSSLFLPTDKFAASIPIPGKSHGQYDVVIRSIDDIVGVDAHSGEAIPLSKQEVLVYRFHAQAMICNVAKAFGFEYRFAHVDGDFHAFRIGTFIPFAGFAFPAYCIVPHESGDLQQSANAIAALSECPFIVMAPTRDFVRPAFEALLKRRQSCFFSLCDAIEVGEDGAWALSTSGAQQLTEFRRTVIPQSANRSGEEFFPTPAGATWGDLSLRFNDGHTISAKMGQVSLVLSYAEMGMVDLRNKKPTKQWELLRSFADDNGHYTWKSPGASKKNQKRREDLARDLRKFFRIDADPIVHDADSKGWRTLFTIRPS